MPLYVADYLADTAHLSAAEHGGYLMLIMNYWQRAAPLPDDDRKLARIARMTDDEWRDARPSIAEYFDQIDGEWRHSRIDAELAEAAERISRAKAAGQASGAARAIKREPEPNGCSTPVEPEPNGRSTGAEHPLNHNITEHNRTEGCVGLRAPARETPDATADLRQSIVSAFSEVQSATIPDTSRAGVWIAKGYQPAICLATIREGLARKPDIRSLAYFDRAIADAHAAPVARAPPSHAPPRRLTILDGLALHDARTSQS